MSKQDRQGARTVAELDRRYNVKKAMGVATDSLATSQQAKSNAEQANAVAKEASKSVGDKIGKNDNSQIVKMLNEALETVILANRLVVNSENFTLSAEGSVVARDITIQNGKDEDDYNVKIADGAIKINSPTVLISDPEISDVTFQYVDLLYFNISGSRGGVFALYVEMTDQDENGNGGGEWTLNRLGIRRVS